MAAIPTLFMVCILGAVVGYHAIRLRKAVA
jgi:hypothetical protein